MRYAGFGKICDRIFAYNQHPHLSSLIIKLIIDHFSAKIFCLLVLFIFRLSLFKQYNFYALHL